MSLLVRPIEERGGAWLRIVLDRPPGNLLSLDMVRALAACLAESVPPWRKWVTFEGAGDHFSYGAKIEEHVPGVMEEVLPEAHALLRQVLALTAATAALVQGRCLGGGFELALACDTIIATREASLGLPEIQLGVFPPAGSALLPLRVGASRSAAAVLTGVPRSADDWSQDGLIAVVAARWAARCGRTVVRHVSGLALDRRRRGRGARFQDDAAGRRGAGDCRRGKDVPRRRAADARRGGRRAGLRREARAAVEGSMSFQIDIWLRGDNHATTEVIAPVAREPRTWTDGDVVAVLAGMLRAIDKAKHPEAAVDRPVSLRGFSWIVNPYEDGGVVIALEMTLGAVVAGPFDIPERDLTAMIARVMAVERRSDRASPSVH